MNAERDLTARLSEPVERRDGNVYVVPDSANVDHDAIGLLFEDAAAKVCDHDRTGWYCRQLAAPRDLAADLPAGSRDVAEWTWQMATASASAASCEAGGASRPSISLTICCTCCFSARPYPTTARLISAGVYSTTVTPASTAASIATPRAWPSLSALRALTA